MQDLNFLVENYEYEYPWSLRGYAATLVPEELREALQEARRRYRVVDGAPGWVLDNQKIYLVFSLGAGDLGILVRPQDSGFSLGYALRSPKDTPDRMAGAARAFARAQMLGVDGIDLARLSCRQVWALIVSLISCAQPMPRWAPGDWFRHAELQGARERRMMARWLRGA